MTESLHVIVVGGGIAGLCLTQALAIRVPHCAMSYAPPELDA